MQLSQQTSGIAQHQTGQRCSYLKYIFLIY